MIVLFVTKPNNTLACDAMRLLYNGISFEEKI